MVDQTLGNYYIEAKIGEGKFSFVYKARDLRLNRVVAVKVLNEEYVRDGLAWSRLLGEARIASALNHPNVCTLLDIGEERDISYVVLEYIEGSTLRAMIASGPLPTLKVFGYGIQLAEAMMYTHGAGILHRDFKSSNIMVTPTGQIKVIDFGLAKVLEKGKARLEDGSHSSAQEIGWLVGTLPYMAPELLHGDAATIQADVWSLGVILFEMLTGGFPFTGNSAYELGMDIMIGKRKPLPMDIPAGLRGIIHRCLAKDKESRYCSAAEVLTHLKSEFVTFQIKGILANRPSSENDKFWVKRFRSVLLWLSLLVTRS